MDMLRMSTSPRSRCAVRRKVSLLGLLFGLVLGGWTVTAQAFFSLGMIPGLYVPQTYYKHGAVYTRTLVPGPSGRPVYVEYDSSGKEAREIGEAVGAFERAQVMSGDTYRALLKRKSDTLERYPSGEILTAAAYRGKTFKTVTGETISKPNLDEGMLTVIVRAEKELFTIDGKDLVLLQLPVKDGVTPDSASKSLLLSKEGDILAQTANAIGFRVGFFGKDGQVSDTLSRDRDAQIYGPMAGVGVTLGGYIPGGYGVTDSNGKYSMNYFLPSCPGFVFEYTTPAFLELQYKRFNPRGGSYMPYYMTRQDYDVCNGLGVYSLSAAMVIATAATPIKRPMDFPVDLMVIDGAATVKGAKVGDSTAYSAETSDRARTLQEKYDFDGDEKPEFVVPGKKVTKQVEGKPKEVFVTTSVEEAEFQGIYLSSRYDSAPTNTEETAPDFTRLIDTAADFKDRGLLESITTEDLTDTDIYVFRESNGQLVAERRGLHENELYKTYSGVDDGQGAFRFTIQLRGSAENFYSVAGRTGEANFTKWQSAGGFKEEFQKRTANHLKAGEQVRIIAINRPTGYIGSKSFQLQSSLSGNLINLNSQQIQMGPPNLKIWAERKSKIESGMTKGDEKKQLIGNEGAGLGSDISIAIYSDWRDADGSPLPEELADYGYTGRLAKIVAANQLAPVGANSLSQFKIKPGQQVQVIQLPEKVLAKQHLYLQVAGQPENRNPNFSSEGAGKGILKHRPTHYVPVLVPLHDEETSEISRQAYRKADKEHPELNLKKPEPRYSWQYRPEMQFSLYDLNVKEIRREDAEGVNTDIYSNKTPTIVSSDRYVSFIYDFIKSSFETLETWSDRGEREIVLAFGQEEVKATIGKGQTIKFEDIGQLGKLDADDFLSLRLYTNNDVGNVLWEFAFETLALESTNIGFKEETASSYLLSADDPQLNLKATLLGYSSRDPDRKKPVTIRWSLQGAGTLANASQTSTDFGVFDNTLSMPTQKGASTKIFVEMLDNPGSKTSWKTVQVTAGEPNRIVASLTGQVEALEQGQARIDVKVYDKYNNLVEDGTPVAFEMADSTRIVERQLETVDGKAFIVVTGGELDTSSTKAVITSGVASTEMDMSIKGATIELIASKSQPEKGESVTLTAKVKRANGQPAVGVPVVFDAGHGVMQTPYQLTDSAGVAKSTFVAGLNASDDIWRAQVGYIASAELNFKVVSGSNRSIEAQDAMLVADVAEPGVVTYDNYGVSVQAAYEVSGSLQVASQDGGRVQIGDMSDPNLEPLLSLQMSSLDMGTDGKNIFTDEVGGASAVVSSAEIVRDHPLGGGRSSAFTAGGRATVANSALLELGDGLGVRLDIKPSASGDVLDVNGTHHLAYQGDRMVYTARTTEGEFSVALDGVAVDAWHRVAVRMWQGQIELYVDGRTARTAYTGAPDSVGSGLVVGGLAAHIRSVKMFDWNSAPLISFANGSSTASLQAGANKLVVSSLGSLGKRVVGSQLKQLRVAVVSGQERNFISLLTRNGFAELAGQMMDASPPADMPISQYQLSNPVSRLIPSAYAWTWDTVWETAKEGVGLLIPYEDFITIGEQLIYWSNDDPRFDAGTLAFAAIGAATVIPVAKPIKPFLAPAKKMVAALKKFPGIKHFAGAIGSSVKGGLSGNTKRLEQLLPFILLGVELYQDEESFSFMMNAIQSEDDLWVWVDYLSQLAQDAGGFGEETASIMVPKNASWLVNNSGLVPYAYALTPRQKVAADLTKALRRLSKSIKNPKEFTPALKEVLKEMKNEGAAVKKLMTDGTFLNGAMALGAAKIRHFFTSSKNWRVRREVVLFAVLYLSEEQAAGRLNIDKSKFASLLADLISGFAYKQHGAIFQLVQMMGYQIKANYGPAPKMQIVGIDEVRQAYRLADLPGVGPARDSDQPYKRRIDIVLAPDGDKTKEQWVELKSLAGPFSASWFDSDVNKSGNADDTNDEARGYYRQFFHDLRLNQKLVNTNNLGLIVGQDGQVLKHQGNSVFFWYFQDFKQTPTSSKSPTKADEAIAQKAFCALPRGLGDATGFYKQNFAQSAKVTARECQAIVKLSVSLRDTKSYFEEYLVTYADQLDIKDFINIVKNIGE
ncbi:Ig-like domain-containing protein [Pseudomonas argentinensis]|uniref:Ig-like domain-containing protein n=1 Tax=Phytopseudomonas argentinensis TaxID=289370 RepID=UPI0008AA4ED3|nr:Ig-like domain-containing protein [Pseudomonas argentinensis]